MATAAKTPKITITKINSIIVKPFMFLSFDKKFLDLYYRVFTINLT
ncbi:hypothetical protein CAMGR0001_0053 [Campylobacter gracilis RM3268]|uniref:Uncharacterized protein n=1 Tax=Campylobacter gracilis RM3268 TaxID=553220 RepID=C8PI71_9BACT|nr:hypothetical protein CAMGR0001_0053 [Campylobacter gracilis RM3268]